MKVSIVGTGYVGLVSGACLAGKGHEVVCIDVDSDKVDKINSAVCPIYEAGLEELLRENVGSSLTASTDLHEAILESEITLIAVGTPFDGSAIEFDGLITGFPVRVVGNIACLQEQIVGGKIAGFACTVCRCFTAAQGDR